MIRLKKLLLSILFFLIHHCKKIICLLNKNPLLIKTKTFHIVYFGIFAAVGVFAFCSIFLFYIDAKCYTFHYSYFIIFGIIYICLLVFNKIFHIFAIGRDFFSSPSFYLNQTAMYNQSGIFAMIISIFIISYLENIPLIIALDGAAYAVVIALFFGRIGCFNYGCCFGKPSNNYFTVIYTNLNSKILRLYPELKNVAVIPTQLYSALFNLILFILFTINIKLLPLNGSITILFIVLYNPI
ncbi:MAG: prolipoprotein diacylglyceryl transferase [Armatimonadetes bacterium]|nr:prolipoprotein diacylglyceryl transferase [Armatimonadota bacterium]